MMSIRRSLRRLIVGGEFFSNHTYTNYTTTTISSRRIFNSLHLSGYTSECKHYHVDAKTKGGSDYSDDGKEIYKREIRKGDTISLNDLLFTKNRDYLIKNNNQHVKAEQLEGKVIGIYFLPLSSKTTRYSTRYSTRYTSLLKDVYDDLYPANNFEIVLVACNLIDYRVKKKPCRSLRSYCKKVRRSLQSYCKKVFRVLFSCMPWTPIPFSGVTSKDFQDLFSCMPWTAIPFSDVTSRKHIQESFGISEIFPIMYIVDQTGLVLQCPSWDIFEYYGALGYPFSDKRLKILRTEDYLATQQPSLKTLLGSPQRDYLISSNGDKVPIHTFEDKVVALYFYQPDDPDSLTEELKLAYVKFAKIKKIFEVVLIYIREPIYTRMEPVQMGALKSEESFWEVFKTMPWLALPFKDMNYKKLKRVFEIDSYVDVRGPRLVIFGPHADYIEPYGYPILSVYGIEAFPFTCKKAVEFEIEKVKEMKLRTLWNPNTVFRRNDGSQVLLSQLSGKRVILFLETFNDYLLAGEGSEKLITKFLTVLKETYLRKKGTDDEFEVIRILINNTESSISKQLVGDMPWLVSPASELIHDLGSSYYWYRRPTDLLIGKYPLIFAFNLDGRLVRKSLDPKFEDMEFPFFAGGLEEEMLSELITCNGWEYNRRRFRYGGRIYT